MASFIARWKLERSFRDEARAAAYRDLRKHKYDFYYIEMLNSYVRTYCRLKAAQSLNH